MSIFHGWDDTYLRVRWEKCGVREAKSLVMFFKAFNPPIYVFRDLAEVKWRPAHRVDILEGLWLPMLRKNKIIGMTSLNPPRQPDKGIEKWIFIRPGTAPFGDWTQEEAVRYVKDAMAVLEDYGVDSSKMPIYKRQAGVLQQLTH